LHWILILPGGVPHAFCDATTSVFGNATGGKRGSFCGAFDYLAVCRPPALLPGPGQIGLTDSPFQIPVSA